MAEQDCEEQDGRGGNKPRRPLYQASVQEVQTLLTTRKYPESFAELDPSTKRSRMHTLQTYSKKFFLDEKNTLFYRPNRRVLFNRAEIDRVLSDIHGNGRQGPHMAHKRTQTNISARFYWRSITHDVNDWIDTCLECQRTSKIKTMCPELKPIYTSEPWELVGIDLIGPFKTSPRGHKYAVTATCLFTKWVEAEPIADKSAKSVFYALNRWIHRWGAPRKILTDQGSEFNNQHLNEMIYEKFNIRHLVTSAYHPQTNGQDERTNGTIKRHLSKMVNDAQDDWDLYLDKACWGIRSSFNESTKTTPFEVMMIRKPRFPSELLDESDEDDPVFPDADPAAVAEYVRHKQGQQAVLHKQVDHNNIVAKEKQKKYYARKKAKGFKAFDFHVGQQVSRANPKKMGDRKGDRLGPDWLHGFTITNICGNRVQLKSNTTGKVLKYISCEHIKPLRTRKQCGVEQPDVTGTPRSETTQKQQKTADKPPENHISVSSTGQQMVATQLMHKFAAASQSVHVASQPPFNIKKNPGISKTTIPQDVPFPVIPTALCSGLSSQTLPGSAVIVPGPNAVSLAPAINDNESAKCAIEALLLLSEQPAGDTPQFCTTETGYSWVQGTYHTPEIPKQSSRSSEIKDAVHVVPKMPDVDCRHPHTTTSGSEPSRLDVRLTTSRVHKKPAVTATATVSNSGGICNMESAGQEQMLSCYQRKWKGSRSMLNTAALESTVQSDPDATDSDEHLDATDSDEDPDATDSDEDPDATDSDEEVSVQKEHHRRLGPDDTIRHTPLQKQEMNSTAGSKRRKVQACPNQLQPKGLSNPGDNRCWANAAIQCLTAIGAGDYFINNDKDNFLHWLGEFMSIHMCGQLGQPGVVDTTELIGKIRSEFPTLSSNGEQDSVEFLMLLLDRMEGPWTLKLSLKRKCNECGWISPTCIQQDSQIHIHTHGVESDVLRVSELLHESFHEGLESTQLPCKVKGHKGYQETSITSSSSGSFLILVMERAIDYQATLSDSRDLEVEEKLSVGQHEYQLMAILCYTGSRTTGHYFAKTLREGQWYSFDDGRVSKFNIKKKRASQEYRAFFYRECDTARTQEDHESRGLQEMESRTDQAQEMQPHEEVLAEIDGEKVTRKDMQGLNGTNLLNDTIVNFYMKMIMERSRLTGYPRVHAFCSFFYQQLLQNGYSSVKKWTKGDDLFSMDLVLVPVHLRVKKHWCLAVMDMRSKCINYFDSMGEMNKECLECLRGYLQEEHKTKKGTDLDLSKWTTHFPKNLPKQLNSFDCGVFACKYAEVASRDAKMTFTQHDIPAFRRQMVGEILDKQLKAAVESMTDSSAASPPDSSVCGSGGASIHDDERPKQSESQNAGLDLDILEPLTDSRSDCAELQRRIQARENFTPHLLFGPCEELELRGYFTAVTPYLQRLANGEMPENAMHRVFYGRNQAGQSTKKQLWDMHHTRAFEFEQVTFISQCILDEVKVPIDDLETKANYEVMVLLPEALAAIYKERKGLATIEEAREHIWLAGFQLDLD